MVSEDSTSSDCLAGEHLDEGLHESWCSKRVSCDVNWYQFKLRLWSKSKSSLRAVKFPCVLLKELTCLGITAVQNPNLIIKFEHYLNTVAWDNAVNNRGDFWPEILVRRFRWRVAGQQFYRHPRICHFFFAPDISTAVVLTPRFIQIWNWSSMVLQRSQDTTCFPGSYSIDKWRTTLT